MIARQRLGRQRPILTGTCVVLVAVMAGYAGADEAQKPPYRDPRLPAEQRVADLLGRMTLDEKIAQLRGGWAGTDAYVKRGDKVELDDRWKPFLTGAAIGLLGSNLRADPWTGVTLESGLTRVEGAEFLNRVQRHVVENTRLGIPVFVSDDGHHGQQCIGGTIFPQLCGMGSTWNRRLQEEVARAIALEMRSQGVTIAYAPNLDVIRDPRLGRADQNYGEDPYHVGQMGRAMVRGLQGESLNTDHTVIALLRAYPGVGDVDGGHDFTGFSRGVRDLHEVVLRPWREAIREGAQGVMVEQSEIDGVPIPASRYFLIDVLREMWGFTGITIDDNGAIARLVNWRVAPDLTHAAALGLAAGNDMTLSDVDPVQQRRPAVYGQYLRDALEQGLVSIVDVDRSVARVLRLKFLLGVFERPLVDPQRAETVARSPEHRRLALEAARESIVLLKNSGRTLPLAGLVKSIAVIGPNADDTWNQLGDYAPTHRREDVVTILDGIKARASRDKITVRYARGCGVRSLSKEGFAEAVEAARRSDVVVAVVGGSSKIDFPRPGEPRGRRSEESDAGEAVARATLDLLGVQLELLRALKAAGKPLVVVLIHGRPMTINWVAENADAIVDAWYPGQEGGMAVAEVLFGDYNPGGKLAVSMPKHVGQLPVYYYRKYPGRRYVEMDSEPLYPFGFGLSYTTFKYANLRVTPAAISAHDTAEVRVDVANMGKVAGDEVVQLYLRDDLASVVRPPKELKGFERVHIDPARTKTVAFHVGWDELCFFGPEMKWIVEPGTFTVTVSGNSRDARLNGKLTVK